MDGRATASAQTLTYGHVSCRLSRSRSNHLFKGELGTNVFMYVVEETRSDSPELLLDSFIETPALVIESLLNIGHRNRARQYNSSNMGTDTSQLFKRFYGSDPTTSNPEEGHWLPREC